MRDLRAQGIQPAQLSISRGSEHVAHAARTASAFPADARGRSRAAAQHTFNDESVF